MIKFNLLTEKKENVIYEEVLTNLFFDGLRDGEYGFIIKMDNNNTGLLHWETNNDLSTIPHIIDNISLEFNRERVMSNRQFIPGKFENKLTFEFEDNILDNIFYNILCTRPRNFLNIILITSNGKYKLKVIAKEIQLRDVLPTSLYDIDRKCNKIYFIVENYETII